ncbi:hypothetical protein Poly30_36490 [Planctomycetes bacterium Poly30]|uniref:Uncharacterized protein n=2 Tax=Saltatorellus ferox TaxID=2528018 RepID=A0A518EVJ0_9BACT|nr:hypothetical protein Poly30_36490 [Planctomycetes bacterium Poly30]
MTACAASEPEIEVVSASSGSKGPISAPVVLDPGYAAELVYRCDVRVNGVATGELDPERPGEEIVAVDQLGRVHLIARVGDSFGHQVIASTSGELVQVAVGDLLPSAPGTPAMDEIVAVGAHHGKEDDGGPGIVRVFHREKSGHWAETSYLTPGLVHGVAVGDIGLTEHDQFVCAGFFPQALVGTLTTQVKGGAVAMGIGAIDLPRIGNVKGVALTEEGFVLAADDGHSVEYMVLPGEFGHQPPVQHGSPLSRVAYSKEIGVLLADDEGHLRILSTGPSPTSSLLESSEDRLRGAVFMDIDPGSEGAEAQGLEACSVGYDGRVRVVDLSRVDGKQPESSGQSQAIGFEGKLRHVARDTDKLHDLRAGDIADFGPCLITCGDSGHVLLIHRKDGKVARKP